MRSDGKILEWVNLSPTWGKNVIPIDNIGRGNMDWINVKDRLPTKDGRYLVVESHLYDWVGVCSLRKGKWDNDCVTYWMPLPEAPK